MNQLTKHLMRQVGQHRKIVCVFLTLGYRSLGQTERLISAFEQVGVDVIELGLPFSDPLADGPTIQHSSDEALKSGIRTKHAFRLVDKLRRKGVRLPILLFSYFNPIFRLGAREFARRLKNSGFQGVIVPDLPPDEERTFQSLLKKRGLAQVHLAAPTSEDRRILEIARRSDGFIYYVSLRGVTGARKVLDPELAGRVIRLKKMAKKPVLVGFGVSDPAQVRKICRFADGVIIGSAVINVLTRSQNRETGFKQALRFVRSMVRAARASSLRSW